MHKNKLYILIALISIGLLGLAYLQISWINESLSIKREQYNVKVYSALQKTIQAIESRDAYHQTSDVFCEFSFFENDSNLLYQYDSLLKKQANKPNLKDSMSVDFRLFDLQNKPLLITQKSTIRRVGDKVITQKVQFDTSRVTDQVSESKIDGNIRVFEKLVKNYMVSGKDLNQRIDSAFLFNQLKTNLHDEGIDGNFIYKVENTENEIMLTNENKPNSGRSFEYQVKLFANDIFGKGGTLMLCIHNDSFAIFKSIFGTLFLSFLFISLVIGCMGIGIKMIYDQRKLSQLKTDFINNMTHELKTPVATISMASEMMRNTDISMNAERFKKYANIIFDENKRLGQHIEAVLNISQLERNELKLDKQAIGIHSLLNDIVERNHLRLENLNASVHFEFNATNDWVQCDKMHMNNVLNNLLDNAIKYSPDKVDIIIKTENTENNKVQISFTDKGMGIAKENLNKIFQKFYRVEGGNIQNIKGFGLGLSYVKSIVEAHNGTIFATSKVGEGSTFQITLNNIK